ncbi:MAG TPA: nucleotidyltransferase family protein [Rhodocyclaceae bacterium]|nr:nucleotidyltransferase family protein [Rhodocyclaceae bacterium]
MEPLVGLLLAAGTSRRFGSDKLLQPLRDHEPIVVASARRLAAATDRTIVLVRPEQPALRNVLASLPVEIVEVQNACAGMGATLAAGVRTAFHAAGWVVALGDMPSIREETMRRVAAALRAGAPIAAPYFGGRRGHPVGFARQWREALVELDGDEGARALLLAHSESIVRLEVDDQGCLFDIDVPGDLDALVPALVSGT